MSAQMLRPSSEYIKTRWFNMNVQGEDTKWAFRIYPNGLTIKDENYVSFDLCLPFGQGNKPITAKCTLHLGSKNEGRKLDFLHNFTYDNNKFYKLPKLISHC